MKEFLRGRKPRVEVLPVDGIDHAEVSSTLQEVLAQCFGSEDLIPRRETWGVYEVYALTDAEEIVVRFARHGERAQDLVREFSVQNYLRDRGLPLQSPAVSPLTQDRSEVVVFTFLDRIEGRQPKTGIIFQAPRGYARSLFEDPHAASVSPLSHENFLTGIKSSIHDVFLLARHGLYHTLPFECYVDPMNSHRHRRSGQFLRYAPSPDLALDYMRPSGMRSLVNWPWALSHANFGPLGLRPDRSM
jgi:hypothetical protein